MFLNTVFLKIYILKTCPLAFSSFKVALYQFKFQRHHLNTSLHSSVALNSITGGKFDILSYRYDMLKPAELKLDTETHERILNDPQSSTFNYQ